MGSDPPGEGATLEGPRAVVALRVVAAASWHVVRGRRYSDFPRALTFVERVTDAAPELVAFQHLVRLRLGLQAKIVMNMLEEDQSSGKIYDALDTYFPENAVPLLHSKATAEELEMVQTAQENFRTLVLKLLSERIYKDVYMQEFLEIDYGTDFTNMVEKLFRDYLRQMEYTLPEPEFQMLLEAASIQSPSQLPQPSAAILNQYFSAMGYQWAGCAGPPTSPLHPSCAPRQNKDKDPHMPPLSSQPGSSRSVDSHSCISEWDLHGQISETPEDLVPESESERSISPFQGEYQGTHFCTLIPTFQEYLRESSSQLNSSEL